MEHATSLAMKEFNLSQLNHQNFVNYDYLQITATKEKAVFLINHYTSFGWELEKEEIANERSLWLPFVKGLMKHKSDNRVTLTFKRNCYIENKQELNQMQQTFEKLAEEINYLESLPKMSARMSAFFTGLMGIIFLAFGTFAYLAAMIPLMIILASLGFSSCLGAFFLYQRRRTLKEETLKPVIQNLQDAVYLLTNEANELI